MSDREGGYRAVLPRPASTYNEQDQQNNRREILRALDRKLDRNEPAIYGGIPMLIVAGSNTDFQVPTGGAYVTIPITTTLRHSDVAATVDTNTDSFSTLVETDWDVRVELQYNSGGSGPTAELAAALYGNGVLIDQSIILINPNTPTMVKTAFIVLDATPGVSYDIRVAHTDGGTLHFDLAKSLWGLLRLSTLERLQK